MGDGPLFDARREAEVVTVGETMALFWAEDDAGLERATLYRRSFAGAESNVCVALARLEHRSRWISRLGDDAFGRHIRTGLEREGVLVDAAVDQDTPTGVFFKERAREGPRQVVYYRDGSAASRLAPRDLAAAQVAGARVLHLTGITPALSPSCAAAVDRAIDLARAADMLICVDPNVRLRLWPSADACRRALLALIARADVALIGHEDAAILFPDRDVDAVLAAVRALGPRRVVLKRGAQGAVAETDEGRVAVPAYAVATIDTVGAGDGFDAGFLAGLLEGAPLPQCLVLGARVGAAAVAHVGDWEGYPRRGEIGL